MSIKRTLIVTFTASETQKLWKCKTLCSALILPCQKATESINLDLKYSILYCLGSDSLVHSIGFVNALPLPCPMNTMLTEVRLITDTVLSKDYTPFIIVNPDLNVVLDIQTDYQILLRLRSQCKGKGDWDKNYLNEIVIRVWGYMGELCSACNTTGKFMRLQLL